MGRIIRAFFSGEIPPVGDELLLDEKESQHLAKVLRIQVGDSVQVLDGQGVMADCNITKVERKSVLLEVMERNEAVRPKPFVHMVVSMTKASRWEEIIRPLTEMGAGGITPLLSQRTEVRHPEEKLESKLLKWKKLAVEACKQSGNAWLPKIDHPRTLDCILNDPEDPLLMASLRSTPSEASLAFGGRAEKFSLIIGPEGGWTEKEENLAVEKGVLLFSLGPTVLRVETAAICALAVARHGFLD